MELIRNAATITDYCHRRRLSIRARLTLFAIACDAIAFAHKKGVIHRDIKPANILVDGLGRVKIIDFGVARGLDSDQTTCGEFIGTLQYSSPEQCRQDVDTRSDVYSLGVVLYELLTGCLPYDVRNTTVHEALRMINEVDPPPLRSQPRGLPRCHRDLETIVRTALAKDRDNRYQSAAVLAEEVRAHQKGDAIRARPPTPWERITRWITRHPRTSVGMGALALIAMTSIASAAITASLVHRAAVAEQIAAALAAELRTPGYLFPHYGPKNTITAVTLRSRRGTEIRTWESTSSLAPGYVFCDFVEMADRAPLVVLGCSHYAEKGISGRLCFFDTGGSLHDAIRTAGVATDEILPKFREALRKKRGIDARGEEFEVVAGARAKIFDDVPGDQFVVVFNRGIWSQKVFRIYDLNGNVRFSCWHDGDIAPGMHWMSSAGLLVLGMKDEQEKRLETGHPLYVVAMRPEKDRHHNTHWLLDADAAAYPPIVAWRLRVCLPDSAKGNEVVISPPFTPVDPARFVRVDIHADNGSAAWTLNERGQPVGHPDMSDHAPDDLRTVAFTPIEPQQSK